MAVIIDGTNGVTTPAESVTGTGVWSVGGSQIYKDASGNVGIGTSSPGNRLTIGDPGTGLGFTNAASGNFNIGLLAGTGSAAAYVLQRANADLLFGTNNTERARIDSSGRLLVNNTANTGGYISVTQGTYYSLQSNTTSSGPGQGHVVFTFNNTTTCGTITTSGGTSTAYNTSSDYRLKNTIAPMTGALDKVALLKPCTYKWNVDGSDGQGFIAHELDEVVPGCVSGEKDAVDAEGKPQYQGIDTSFLVATLTAAIQELKAITDTQATRITALEAANV